jgi:hypothetical protein
MQEIGVFEHNPCNGSRLYTATGHGLDPIAIITECRIL